MCYVDILVIIYLLDSRCYQFDLFVRNILWLASAGASQTCNQTFFCIRTHFNHLPIPSAFCSLGPAWRRHGVGDLWKCYCPSKFQGPIRGAIQVFLNLWTHEDKPRSHSRFCKVNLRQNTRIDLDILFGFGSSKSKQHEVACGQGGFMILIPDEHRRSCKAGQHMGDNHKKPLQ